MDLTRLLLRMAMWVRRPPSREHVIVVVVVLAIAIVLLIVERTVGWPDWLTADRMPRDPLR